MKGFVEQGVCSELVSISAADLTQFEDVFVGFFGGCKFVHHLLSIISLVLGVHSGHSHVYICMVLLSECTTPLVNLRWWVVI
jgi:hypothetical protein